MYLNHCQTLEQLKSEYKRLAKQHHPDCGGSDAEMAALNNEYDAFSARLPKTNAKGETYQPVEREAPEIFRAAILAVMNIPGIELELCGNWIWASGDTRSYKDLLKAAGYRWSHNKAAWYWHEAGYKKYGKKSYTMDEIREMHGSTKVTANRRDELPA